MSWLLLVGDARRARVFEVKRPDEDASHPRFELQELDDLTEPEAGLLGHELFSNTKGRNRANEGMAVHGYDDHRGGHREEQHARFARRISSNVLQRIRELDARRLMVVAPARTLGHLRAELISKLPDNVSVDELEEDLSWHPSPRLRDELTQRGLLPELARA
ncbi:MAG: host attachment protein [Polyangiaceae bacterium]